jgi:hypothetical protein
MLSQNACPETCPLRNALPPILVLRYRSSDPPTPSCVRSFLHDGRSSLSCLPGSCLARNTLAAIVLFLVPFSLNAILLDLRKDSLVYSQLQCNHPFGELVMCGPSGPQRLWPAVPSGWTSEEFSLLAPLVAAHPFDGLEEYSHFARPSLRRLLTSGSTPPRPPFGDPKNTPFDRPSQRRFPRSRSTVFSSNPH